ncbi:MAG: hypothetical protein ACPLKS_00395 [Caldisericum exile]|uniref:hypothetical protein n=1 Tax=Caldisericum exile TaxID=693075 RepID=UPI003C7475A4
MEYLLFTFQIIFAGHLLIQKIERSINYGFILYYFLIFFAIIIFYLMSKLESSKVIVLFLSFILGTFLGRVSNLLNVLPFSVLYFYVIDKMKENEVFERRHYFFLAWIPLMGLISVGFRPILKEMFATLFNSIFSFLFVYNSNFSDYQISNSQNFFNILRKIGNENVSSDIRLLVFANVLSLAVSFAILIILTLLFVSILRTNTQNMALKKRRSLIDKILMFLLVLISIFIIFVSLANINKPDLKEINLNLFEGLVLLMLYFSFVILIYRISKRYVLDLEQKEYYKAPKKLMILLSVFFVLIIVGLFVIMLSGEQTLLAFVSLSTIGFLIFISYYIFTLRGEITVFENRKFFKETKELTENFKKFGKDYLNMISDPKEFVIYLYFLSLINFDRVGFKFKEGMTPKEFLVSVSPYLKSDLFITLTNAFYVAEYSNEEIDPNVLEVLKKNTEDILNEILSLDAPKGQ